MKLTHLIVATALAALPAMGLAQTTPYQRHHVAARKGNQQGRIGQGVKSGQLRPGETAHLEHQERGINQEERGMRAEDNGHLTAQDRHTLAHQQNQESRRIYRDKHNDRTDPGVPPKQ
jgi:DNA-binding transcriptional regulator of glucitol operon